ncbi:MAG: NAD(P)-dependent oxidoreductase, partial [Deltaproteobacteria bacterium]|nr:NAD(P)-dependent oxidoreductase [Deltaproteobacteria bacterium]
WVFSPVGHCFPKTILRLAMGRQNLAINNDQIGAPTSAYFLASVTALAARDYLSGLGHEYGLYNLASSGETSWLGYAECLLGMARDMGFGSLPKALSLTPSFGQDPLRPAKRPLNSRLETFSVEKELGIKCPPWQSEVAKFLYHLSKVDPSLKNFSP